jgi:hypothetical protein
MSTGGDTRHIHYAYTWCKWYITNYFSWAAKPWVAYRLCNSFYGRCKCIESRRLFRTTVVVDERQASNRWNGLIRRTVVVFIFISRWVDKEIKDALPQTGRGTARLPSIANYICSIPVTVRCLGAVSDRFSMSSRTNAALNCVLFCAVVCFPHLRKWCYHLHGQFHSAFSCRPIRTLVKNGLRVLLCFQDKSALWYCIWASPA